jgi:HK97 gp10 family phage protein
MARQQTVTVEGLDRLRDKLDRLPKRIREGAQTAVTDETEAVATDMRDAAPVLTGELRDSIVSDVDAAALAGQARATARHATFVEHGTSSTEAQPFAQPAAEASRARFPKRLREEVGVLLNALTHG